MSDATEKLTAALAAGDEDAVETFYNSYFDWLYAQARRATRRDESFCLDVVQDAMLRIIRTVRAVRDEPQFRAWLRLVVQTTAWDRLRSDAGGRSANWPRWQREKPIRPSRAPTTNRSSGSVNKFAAAIPKLRRCWNCDSRNTGRWRKLVGYLAFRSVQLTGDYARRSASCANARRTNLMRETFDD